MRIRDSGTGFFGFGGGGGSRSDSFKKGRRVGQKLRGTLLKWVSENLAWVVIDGHKLLAQLQSRPPVGARLTFIIKQLHPEVVLKEIFDASTAGVSALSLARGFENARTLFENRLREHVKLLSSIQQCKRSKAFLDILENDKKLLTTFLDTASCVSAINQSIDTNKQGWLSYNPWLLPSGRRHISILRNNESGNSSGLIESISEFELGDFGMVRVEFLFKHPDTGYRLKLQHLSRGNDLKTYLDSRKYPNLKGDARCLSISQLPQSAHGGILAELMFKR